MRKEALTIAGVVTGSIALIVGLAFLGARPRRPITDVTSACIQHAGVGMHIHQSLKILIDGVERKIPAEVGVTPGCMRPIHTHDDSGTIHLEFPVEQEVRLGQFFAVWDQPFSLKRVLDHLVGADEEVRMTVNGEPSAAFGDLVLRDGQEIVVEARKKEGTPTP